MALSREDLVRMVRDCVTTSDVDNPITFDPPEWALRAVQRAFDAGHTSAIANDILARAPAAIMPGYCDRTLALHIARQDDQVAELRDALSQMLDGFGHSIDKQVLREYRALVRGPAAEGVPDEPIEGGA